MPTLRVPLATFVVPLRPQGEGGLNPGRGTVVRVHFVSISESTHVKLTVTVANPAHAAQTKELEAEAVMGS